MTDFVSASGDTADIEVCKRVSEVLQKHFPGHLWLIGADHQAGTVVIDLPYAKPMRLREMRFMLYLSTCLGSDAEKHIMRAGGELLERFGLARGEANKESYAQALEHGLNADAAILKSKY